MKKFETDVKKLADGSLKRRYLSGDKFKFNAAQTDTFRHLLTKNYESALDVGCGEGYFSYVGAVKHKFHKCYGCDIKKSYQISELEPITQSVVYQHLTSTDFPFDNNFFDIVFSMDVIEHVANDVKFISEHFRVCRKGGQIIIGTPNYMRPANIALKCIGKLCFPRGDGDCIHLREYKKHELVTLIVKASKHQISPTDIEYTSCWFGILPLNIGIHPVPRYLTDFCHFMFFRMTKTW